MLTRYDIINLKALILDYENIKHNLSVEQKVKCVESVILAFFKNPEILARYPHFRIIFLKKYKEYKGALNKKIQ